MKPVSEQWMVELVLQVESVLILDYSQGIPYMYILKPIFMFFSGLIY